MTAPARRPLSRRWEVSGTRVQRWTVSVMATTPEEAAAKAEIQVNEDLCEVLGAGEATATHVEEIGGEA